MLVTVEMVATETATPTILTRGMLCGKVSDYLTESIALTV